MSSGAIRSISKPSRGHEQDSRFNKHNIKIGRTNSKLPGLFSCICCDLPYFIKSLPPTKKPPSRAALSHILYLSTLQQKQYKTKTPCSGRYTAGARRLWCDKFLRKRKAQPLLRLPLTYDYNYIYAISQDISNTIFSKSEPPQRQTALSRSFYHAAVLAALPVIRNPHQDDFSLPPVFPAPSSARGDCRAA